jgi:hypothetical protein
VGRVGEHVGSTAVDIDEVPPIERVHQVVGDVLTAHRVSNAGGIGDVPIDDLSLILPGHLGQLAGGARDCSHLMAGGQ